MKKLLLALSLSLLACSNSPAPAADLAGTGDMSIGVSCCGQPGDKGNALGVGKFCQGLTDCSTNSKANICSTLGNSPTRKTYFCTFLCDGKADMAGANVCGDGAACTCDSGGAGCACTPVACTNNPNPPPGCNN